MKYRSAFCTLDSVIRQLELADSSDNDLSTDIDTLIDTKYANSIARIKELIYEISEWVYNKTNRVFVPYKYTYTLREVTFRQRYHYDLGALFVWADDDLLSIDSVTWVGTTLTSLQFRVGDENTFPNSRFEVDSTAITSYPTAFDESVAYTGVFGYHNNASQLWLDSGDTVQDNPLAISATTLNVSDGGNFETYQYIRIEDEYLFITAISTNALTVQRGVNGSTAAAHDSGTQIDILNINELAENATRRLTVMEFNNPGELGNIIPLPDGTVELNPESRITLPPYRHVLGYV